MPVSSKATILLKTHLYLKEILTFRYVTKTIDFISTIFFSVELWVGNEKKAGIFHGKEKINFLKVFTSTSKLYTWKTITPFSTSTRCTLRT